MTIANYTLTADIDGNGKADKVTFTVTQIGGEFASVVASATYDNGRKADIGTKVINPHGESGVLSFAGKTDGAEGVFSVDVPAQGNPLVTFSGEKLEEFMRERALNEEDFKFPNDVDSRLESYWDLAPYTKTFNTTAN